MTLLLKDELPKGFKIWDSEGNPPFSVTYGTLINCNGGTLELNEKEYRIQVNKQEAAAKASGDGQPPKKKLRALHDSKIMACTAVKLYINSEKMLNPLKVESIKYFGRPGLQEVFEELVRK